jgi:hypothetical protein
VLIHAPCWASLHSFALLPWERQGLTRLRWLILHSHTLTVTHVTLTLPSLTTTTWMLVFTTHSVRVPSTVSLLDTPQMHPCRPWLPLKE